MSRLSARSIAFLAITSALSLTPARHGMATPITQKLSRGSSSIKFGVDSPAPVLQMNGNLKTFNGNVTLDPNGSTISGLTVALQLDSAQLPPDQMLQGIFLQSVIARLQQRIATFRSDSISSVTGNQYLATGSYTWHNKTRRATVPFQLIRVSPSATELRVLMRGGLTDATTPQELASAAPGASQSSGWAQAKLVFQK